MTERHYINRKLVVPDYRAATDRLAPRLRVGPWGCAQQVSPTMADACPPARNRGVLCAKRPQSAPLEKAAPRFTRDGKGAQLATQTAGSQLELINNICVRRLADLQIDA